MTRERARRVAAGETFAPVPSSARAARRFALAALPELGREDGQRVALVVSELATNAVLHAGTPFSVRIEWAGAEVRVSVTDAGRGMPSTRDPGADEPAGRGLRIVAAVADTWGVVRSASGATTVWCVVIVEAPVR